MPDLFGYIPDMDPEMFNDAQQEQESAEAAHRGDDFIPLHEIIDIDDTFDIEDVPF